MAHRLQHGRCGTLPRSNVEITLYRDLDPNHLWVLFAHDPTALVARVREAVTRHVGQDNLAVCLKFDPNDDNHPQHALCRRESGYSQDESKSYWEVIHYDAAGDPFHEEFLEFAEALDVWMNYVPRYIRPIAGTP